MRVLFGGRGGANCQKTTTSSHSKQMCKTHSYNLPFFTFYKTNENNRGKEANNIFYDRH